jgi:hypothetical protein
VVLFSTNIYPCMSKYRYIVFRDIYPSSALLLVFLFIGSVGTGDIFTVMTEARFLLHHNVISYTGTCGFHCTQIQILQRICLNC